MASWHFHNHVSVQLQISVGVPQKWAAVFHLGCFAPDLVERSADKRDTHFTVDIGTVPFYPFSLRRFLRWSAPYAALSARHRWFYRGYAVHLLMDRCWMHECAYPFLARRLFAGVASQATYAAYYADMLAYDSYHRHLAGREFYEVSIGLLRGVDVAELLPPILTPTKITDLIGVLEKTRGTTTHTYAAKYVPWHRVSRFLNRSEAVSQRYVRQAMLSDAVV